MMSSPTILFSKSKLPLLVYAMNYFIGYTLNLTAGHVKKKRMLNNKTYTLLFLPICLNGEVNVIMIVHTFKL